MGAVRSFLFVFCFTAEVHVRADTLVQDRPAGCLQQSAVCAVQTRGSVFHFRQKSFELHLGEQSLIIRQNPAQIDFINGTVWLQKYDKMTVGTLYGQVSAERGPFWILQDKDKIWIRNVNADLNIKLRDGRKMELPVGFQVWIGGADENGKNVAGIPEMIPVENHLKLWSRMYDGEKSAFAAEVAAIRLTWGSLPERSSQLYIAMARRQKYLVDHRIALFHERKVAEEDETKKIRDLYYQKTFWR